MLADEIGRPINISTVSEAANEINAIGKWDGAKASFKSVSATARESVGADEAILTSWRRLLDNGSLQEGEANLAGTARKTVAVISPKRAEKLGAKDGDLLKISTAKGAIILPALVEAIHDDAIWAPRNSIGSELLRALGTASNSIVTVVKL